MSDMSRRQFLRNGSLMAGAMLAGTVLPWRMGRAQASGRRPNIMWIGIDDLNCNLGCYGDPQVHSPHIDALAGRGVRFERAYVQQAVCSASRASFLTGCRPDTTTVDYPYNDYFTNEFLPAHPALPGYFHNHGYHGRGMGKIHHGPPLDLMRIPEQYLALPGGVGGYAIPENNEIRPPTEMADVPDEAYRDGLLAEGAIETLHRWKDLDQPWCLTVGFMKPHLPFAAPKRYWDLYRRDEIDLAPSPHLPEGAPGHAIATFELPNYAGKLGTRDNPIDEDTARLLRHGYYACVSYIDALIGRVLAALDATGQRDNTIVMLWSDHGFHLGDNGAWGKHMNYEWATRTPLIVDTPGIAAASRGAASYALVEFVDMFPTLCELTGVAAPDYLEGTSMVPLLDQPNRPWKSAAFSQYPRWGEVDGRSIRTDRYRYVEWQRTGKGSTPYWAGPAGSIHSQELYDHQVDPLESVSLAAKPEHKALVEQLSAQLAAGWRAALPQG